MKAQRGYYGLADAKRSVEARIDAIREHMAPGSSVIDIGCNNGRIVESLMESGHAAHALGVDLEDIRPEHLQRDPRMQFMAWNANELDVAALPPADYVLLLNILHHMICGNTAKAAQTVYALDRYPVVFIDLGSMTEKGGFGWKKHMKRYWGSDEAVIEAMTPSTWSRQPILRYGAQGGGRRTLWKMTTTK